MFEFYLKYGQEEGFIHPYDVANPFHEGKKFKMHAFSFDNFQMKALSNRPFEEFVYDTSEHFLAISGYAFFRYNFKELGAEPLSPERLFNLIKSDKEFFKKIKGNFSIIHYNKQSGTFRFYTDLFALYPSYYTKVNGEIYISNNLNHFKYFSLPVDEVVLLEQLIFGFPLAKETVFKGVKQLPGGALFEAKGEESSIKNLSRLSELVFKEDLHRFDIKEFNQIFNFALSQKLGVSGSKVIELKDDLNSRLMAAGLMRKNVSFQAVSSGLPGSSETKVPYALSADAGFDYHAIYLEEEYENAIGANTLEQLYFSDGQCGVESLDKLYEAKEVGKESRHIYRADMGEHLLLPLSRENQLFEEDYIEYIYEGKDFNLNQLFEDRKVLNLLNQASIDNNKLILFDKIQEKKKEVSGKKLGEEGYLFYIYDLFKLSFRKTYGSQYHSQRFYVENLPVFFDIDIFQYLIRSQHNQVYKDALKESTWKSIGPYQLYAQMIQLNEPDMNKVVCDKGFIPLNLLNILKRPIAKSHMLKHIKQQRSEKNPNAATLKSFCTFLNQLEWGDSKFFNKTELQTLVENFNEADYSLTRSKIINLYTWLHLL